MYVFFIIFNHNLDINYSLHLLRFTPFIIEVTQKIIKCKVSCTMFSRFKACMHKCTICNKRLDVRALHVSGKRRDKSKGAFSV